MGHTASKRLAVAFGILGAVGLFILLWFNRKKSNALAVTPQVNPKLIILQTLMAHGINESTAKQWVTVSALETFGWTSKVYQDTNNLFMLILPDSLGFPHIDYGEKQTIFESLPASSEALYKYVIKYFKYPLSFPDIRSQAEFMKSKGYYGGTVDAYVENMKFWYSKLF